MPLQLEQTLTLEEKIAVLETAVYVSSEDDDYFVIKGDDGFVAVICETAIEIDDIDFDKTTPLYHRVIQLHPCPSLDEAVVVALWVMTGDNGGEQSRNPAIKRLAPKIKHYG